MGLVSLLAGCAIWIGSSMYTLDAVQSKLRDLSNVVLSLSQKCN